MTGRTPWRRTPDAAPWWRLARVLDEQAGVLRAEAARIATAGAHTRWRSPAGRAFTARAAEAALGAARAAGRLAEAADAARRHAAALEATAAGLTSGVAGGR